MIKRIAIVGPESTGKSILAKELAIHFESLFVPEFARVYIDELKRPYNQTDLLEIARMQCLIEDSSEELAEELLFCDTTLLVIKVWSEFKYGNCDAWILEELNKRKYDLYLLCNIDLPWQKDAQREHPHSRQELFDIYHTELIKMGVEYEIITGKQSTRLVNAINVIDRLKYGKGNKLNAVI